MVKAFQTEILFVKNVFCFLHKALHFCFAKHSILLKSFSDQKCSCGVSTVVCFRVCVCVNQ